MNAYLTALFLDRLKFSRYKKWPLFFYFSILIFLFFSIFICFKGILKHIRDVFITQKHLGILRLPRPWSHPITSLWSRFIYLYCACYICRCSHAHFNKIILKHRLYNHYDHYNVYNPNHWKYSIYNLTNFFNHYNLYICDIIKTMIFVIITIFLIIKILTIITLLNRWYLRRRLKMCSLLA